ncbi:MAG TPA: Spy/CpxP family protein refolding chaperone [Patescibacteria group bacterium]|jgi:hypothetical protein|nr:Spy/CpxP family protein refolding chaperone [Patescibacteria group bacterium]
MKPAVIYWWKNTRHEVSFGVPLGTGSSKDAGTFDPKGPAAGFVVGVVGVIGVRRPLRFLTQKLQLREDQVSRLAIILDDLKTERAQAAVDDRRTIASFADAVEGETFGETRAREGQSLRVRSAGAINDSVVTALGRFHALLDPEQRLKLAGLIRSGAVTL